MKVGTLAYATEHFGRTGVYMIYNRVNGKVYIGSSTQCVIRRCRGHRSKLRLGKHKNKHLQSAWNKYGEGSFIFTILELCLPDLCLAREQFFIDKYRASSRISGYNALEIAGSVKGLRHKSSTKRKLSEKVKAYWRSMTPEEYERARAVRRREFTEQAKANMGKAALGKRHTEETKKKMAIVQKLILLKRWQDPSYREKMLAAQRRRRLREAQEKLK